MRWKTCTPKIVRHWWKILKTAQTDGKIYHVLRLKDLVLLKWWYYSRQSIDSMQSLSNTNGIFQRIRTNNSKISMKTQKTLNRLNSLKKEEQN